MKGGQFLLQDGGGFPTRGAIVSLALRDGVRLAARLRTGEGRCDAWS